MSLGPSQRAESEAGRTVRFLEVEPTTRCNFTCGFCCGRHMVQQDLELATFAAALDAFPETTHLELQGEGEPLLQPRFFEMAAVARARGIGVCCITNGSLLSVENVERLLDGGFDKIMVSFESLDPETFRRLRGGKVEKVIEGLDRLMRRRRERALERPSVGLAVTVLRQTVSELPAFVALARQLGLDGGIDFQPLNAMPGYRQHYDASLADQLMSDRELRQHLERLRADPVNGIVLDGTSRHRGFFSELFDDFVPGGRVCPWLERGAYVTADGWVTPCCTIKDGQRAGFGKVGPRDAAERDARRGAMAEQLRLGQTPEACQGCAIAALALDGSAPRDGQATVDALTALELEFSWVHASAMALQRDIRSRLVPAITDAVVRLQELRGRPEPSPPPSHASAESPVATEDLLGASQRENARLSAELAAARTRVQALLSSRSWKLTGPLRAIHSRLGPRRP